jgi:hypothetical protein
VVELIRQDKAASDENSRIRAPINVVITAAANKLARIAWAVLSSGQEYRPTVSPMPA